ncbi:hypothetical protein PMAYCL1PPCAC_10230, partial [Pristionchus mayeri]
LTNSVYSLTSLIPRPSPRNCLLLLGEALVLENFADDAHDLGVHLVAVCLELVGGAAHLLVEVLCKALDGLGEGGGEVVVRGLRESLVVVADADVVLNERLLGAGLEHSEVAGLHIVELLEILGVDLLQSRLEVIVGLDEVIVDRGDVLLEEFETLGAGSGHGDLSGEDLVVQVDERLEVRLGDLLHQGGKRRRDAIFESQHDFLGLFGELRGDLGVDRPIEIGDGSSGGDGAESGENGDLHT